MIALTCAALLLSQTPGPVTAINGAPGRALKRPYLTWVTGELGATDVIFEVAFDPRIAGSARAKVLVVEPRGAVDGIDFVPGGASVVVGMPTGILSHYDLTTGAILPDWVADTDLVVPPPAGPGTHPSTVWSTPSHVYYVENQFGFGATASHRLMRKPFGPGPVELVFNGAMAGGLKNFEGLEGFGGRLYFFAEDPALATARALVSIGVMPAGVWDGMPPAVHVGGLFEDPASTDGSDELDFDPVSGLLFGTNIENGEVVAWHPGAGLEVSSPGALHFVDGGQVSASSGALAALGAEIDGIRSVGNGWLVFTGKGGVMVSLDIAGVLADGADDGDARVLFSKPGLVHFDDLTPIVRP
ncbi:MAG: hypothetical protein ABL998_03115 [Planctomycetota bacterium]